MNKNYKLALAYNYLKSKRKEKFISLISIISIAGITIGVMTLIIVLSVMDGFDHTLREKIININSHLIILKYGDDISNYQRIIRRVEKIKGIKFAEPFIYRQAMISTERGGVTGVVVRGILPNSRILKKVLKKGKLLNNVPSIVIGKEISENLGIYIGDNVNIVSPFGRLTPMGVIPKMKKFKVTGIFQSGMYDYDSSMVFISIKEAQGITLRYHDAELVREFDVQSIQALRRLCSC